MDKRAIGVFDSGLGGLTVVKELISKLPGEDIVYFGDTARIPYGTRSKEAVGRYSAQCVRFLQSQGVKLIVVACNTVSSCCLDLLQDNVDIPIIGVIKPGARAALEVTSNNRIGIIGTKGTISSGAYENTINSLNPDITLFSRACSLFVPIAEEGWAETDIAYLAAKRYLDDMRDNDIDTLILGCTHYPLLSKAIGQVMGTGVTLVDPAEGTAKVVAEYLYKYNKANRGNNIGDIKFFVSDFGQGFEQIGSRFLNKGIISAQHIDIEKY